jgi:hypothetical protein
MGDHSGTDRSHTKGSPAKIDVKNSPHKALQRSELEVNPEVDLLLRKYSGHSSMTTPQKDTAKIYMGGFIRQPSENVALSPDRSRNQDFPTPKHPPAKKNDHEFRAPQPQPAARPNAKIPRKRRKCHEFQVLGPGHERHPIPKPGRDLPIRPKKSAIDRPIQNPVPGGNHPIKIRHSH